MVVLRRFLTGLLVLAVAHFGVLATAPAHAHEDASGHGVREIVLSHNDAEGMAHHHDGGDDHAGHEDAADAVATEIGSSDSGTDDASHSEHAHVHACPQFAPVMQLAMAWPARAAQAVSYLSSPPLRPPRQRL